jgi:lipoprotein-anchoring transpeptidase ErfK/SrfK
VIQARPARRPTALTALLAVLALCVSCTSGTKNASGPTASGSSAPTTSPGGSSSSSASKSAAPGKPVHVSSIIGDGTTFGVGMPLIVLFSRSPTSRSAFEKAARVKVNGRDAGGAWFWEKVYAGQPVQAHYRPQLYWPAHSHIQVNLPVQGLSAGKGLTFANNLTLDYRIGPSHISIIDAHALRMKVYSDGKLVKSFPVSLGAAKTPTFEGVKVVMDKKNPQRMIGPGYNELVPYSVRVTLSGEFIHDAYWNTNIGRISTSNGCTNLTKDNSKWFYRFARIGDVAQYPNASGRKMQVWDGYGDWNLDWTTWQAGGTAVGG